MARRCRAWPIGPAARVPLAFVGLLDEALARGELGGPSTVDSSTVGAAAGALPVTGPLAEQADALSAALARPASGPGGAAGDAGDAGGAAPATVPPDVLVRAVIAWTQLFGMISFELFGQFVGSFEPADALFGHAAEQLAAFVGLH